MIKLKKLSLKNYCGYHSAEFDFSTKKNTLKNLVCFFGPNGCGKTTLLTAINVVSSAPRFYGRGYDLFFRKMTYHPDYEPSYERYQDVKNKMELIGIFDVDGCDKETVITTEGLVKNELPTDHMEYSYFIDADHPMNTHKFQLHEDMDDVFVDIAKTVYGYDCYLDKKVNDIDEEENVFYTDFVIVKPDGTKVHYRRMSAGERKIATLLRNLCNPLYMSYLDILLVDNFCMHIYKDRHAQMVNKLLDIFPEKQFFITTHSPVLVGMKDVELGINIPAFLDAESLVDVELIH